MSPLLQDVMRTAVQITDWRDTYPLSAQDRPASRPHAGRAHAQHSHNCPESIYHERMQPIAHPHPAATTHSCLPLQLAPSQRWRQPWRLARYNGQQVTPCQRIVCLAQINLRWFYRYVGALLTHLQTATYRQAPG
jgi:hypothetical protein